MLTGFKTKVGSKIVVEVGVGVGWVGDGVGWRLRWETILLQKVNLPNLR